MKTKLLSVVCALTLAFTAMSSMVVEAATEPNITFELNFSDTGTTLDDTIDDELNFEDYYDAKVYKVELSVKGASKKASVKENGTTVAYTGLIVDSVQAAVDYKSTTDNIIFIKGTGLAGAIVGKNPSKDILTLAWSTTDTGIMIKTDDVVAVTWYVIAEDKGDIEDITLAFNADSIQKFNIYQYFDGTSKEAQIANAGSTNITKVEYPAAPADVKVTKIEASVEKTSFDLYTDKGEALKTTATATVTPDGATDKTVTWSSDNTDVAEINVSTGAITVKAVGEANIKATANDGSNVESDSVKITVTDSTPKYTEDVVFDKTAEKDGKKIHTWKATVGTDATSITVKKDTESRNINGIAENGFALEDGAFRVFGIAIVTSAEQGAFGFTINK